ncbi:MAG: SIS domain-containing protein [Pseudonocardiaceae bacterium]|nr:SIS domain-containing protein [Pseudonocardiaceae bacterium]
MRARLGRQVVARASDDSGGSGGSEGFRVSSPLVRIRSLLPGLARAEQRVAEVVLADAASVAHRSITTVAEAAGTSETTVTRFCKAIGIGGYPELRLALAVEAARSAASGSREVGGDIGPGDRLVDVVAKVAFADARAVEETADQLDIAVLDSVVEVLAAANRVDVCAVGASAFVALDLQRKLHRIGRTAFAWTDVYMALTSAALLTPGDVAVGVSHTGSTLETVDALARARLNGACTVAITNFPRSPITEVADHVLTTAARETTFRAGALVSRTAQLTVVDCLFIGVAQRHHESAQRALASTHEAISARGLDARADGRRAPRSRR